MTVSRCSIAVIKMAFYFRGFPGGPVAETPHLHCRGLGSIPGRGANIQHIEKHGPPPKNQLNFNKK